jgi:hypothetical protein
MWNCQHPECHSTLNCAICAKEGVTWCPHQECRYQRRRHPTGARAQAVSARGIPWTPTLAGNVLKLFFVTAAAAGTWWLLQSGGRGTRAQGKRIGRPRRPVDATKVRELRALGWSWAQIARELGAGLGTVHRAGQ